MSTEDGFTLVEALVATTITVALIALALSAFVAAVGALDQGAQRSATEDAALVARQQLARDMMDAARIVIYPQDSLRLWRSDGRSVVYRTRDSILLRGTTPVLAGRRGVKAYEFQPRAVTGDGDTLAGVADTDRGDVALIHVRLSVGTPRGFVSRSVELVPRARTVWPERSLTPAWPEHR